MYKHLIQETYNYLDDLDKGIKDYKTSSAPALANTMITDFCSNIFSEQEQRNKVKPVLKKYIDIVDKKIKDEKPANYNKDKKPEFSKYLADSIWSERSKVTNTISALNLVDGVLGDKEGDNENLFLNFWFDVCDSLMLNKKPIKERCNISDYNTKANDVLKHIKVGTNVFVTYDFEKEEPQSFIDTIQANAGNSKIVEFNKDANLEYFINAVNKLKYWRENLDTPGFDSILYYLISKADDRNKLKFFVGFPEETIAYILWYTAINKKDFWGTWSKK